MKLLHTPSNPQPRSTPIRVGIAGLGRSGWDIHARTLMSMPALFRVVAVADPVRERRDEARQATGARTHEGLEGVVNDADVELVVVATPNHLHASDSIRALRAGKHVVCEKPMALGGADAASMIAAAGAAGRLLSPFQNRRYEPHHLKVREIIRSGVLGEIVQIRLCWHQFTRRWDWQTLSRYGGGLLRNNGSHLLDHALQLLDDAAGDGPPVDADRLRVWSDLREVLTLGDTEDHVKVMIAAPGGPTVDVELTNACVFEQDRWHVMGRSGGLRGTQERLEWRTIDWAQMPERRLDASVPCEVDRVYHNERIPWKVDRWERPAGAPGEFERFYRGIHRAVREGADLEVTPESVLRLIRLVERGHEASGSGRGSAPGGSVGRVAPVAAGATG